MDIVDTVEMRFDPKKTNLKTIFRFKHLILQVIFSFLVNTSNTCLIFCFLKILAFK